jgi:hypothetical protein
MIDCIPERGRTQRRQSVVNDQLNELQIKTQWPCAAALRVCMLSICEYGIYKDVAVSVQQRHDPTCPDLDSASCCRRYGNGTQPICSHAASISIYIRKSNRRLYMRAIAHHPIPAQRWPSIQEVAYAF